MPPQPVTHSVNPVAPSPSRALLGILQRFGPLLALLLLILGTVIIERLRVMDPESRVFLTFPNFSNILGQWSFVGIIALGMTFVIILGGIDLSVGSIVALAGGLGIYAMNAAIEAWPQSTGLAIALGVTVCLLSGLVMGAVNGASIAWGRIAPFVVTLGTLTIFRSLIVAPSQAGEIRSAVPDFAKLGSYTISIPGLGANGGELPVRISVFVFLALAIVAHFILTRTVFGRGIFAIGDNQVSAKYAGIRINRVTIGVYTICGLCCSISALLNSSRLNSVSSSSLGLFYELDAIAAVVIGGTRLQGGYGSVFGTIIGVLIMGVVSNMLIMLGVDANYQGLVKGCIIIAAVLLQRLLRTT